jgi:hypothetical protein
MMKLRRESSLPKKEGGKTTNPPVYKTMMKGWEKICLTTMTIRLSLLPPITLAPLALPALLPPITLIRRALPALLPLMLTVTTLQVFTTTIKISMNTNYNKIISL